MSAESLKQHKKTRHYQAKLRFLQDTYQAGIVRFHQTGTEDEIADIFTKGLPNDPHWKHTETMLKKLPEHVIASSEAAELILERYVTNDRAFVWRTCASRMGRYNGD